MKKVILVAAIAIAAGFSSKVSAQATIAADAQATIITPISISTTNAGLNFGVLSVKATQGGTCVVSTAGGRTATDGVNLSTVGAAHSAAAYLVEGQEDATFAITLPNSVLVTKAITGETMTINQFTARVQGAGADAITGTLTGASRTMTVGATLNVTQAQVTGVYNGSFDVTVAYN